MKPDAEEITRQDRIAASCLIAYVIVGFLCFGWCYNHPATIDSKTWHTVESTHTVGSVIAGVAWPIWLAATLAITVTKWP